MKTIDPELLVTATGGATKQSPRVEGFARAWKDASSWCPPANTNAGWNCRMAAGRGGML
ncbi:MAG TPA: hypothetical protein VGC41_18040 [Kofleriaceae bacterium]